MILTPASSIAGQRNRSLFTIHFHNMGLINYIVFNHLCLFLLKSFDITCSVFKSSILNGTTKHRITFICKQHALNCSDLFQIRVPSQLSHLVEPKHTEGSGDPSVLNKQLPIIPSLGQQTDKYHKLSNAFMKEVYFLNI